MRHKILSPNRAGRYRSPSVTPPSEEGGYLPGRLRQPGSWSWRSPHRKCTDQRRAKAPGSIHWIGAPGPAADRPVEFRGSTLWSHPFASKRFHVLLNSLFKVLFNFSSWYLLAIGHLSVFSLRWSLPPTLGCIPKQPDSKNKTRDGTRHLNGLTPALGEGPRSGRLRCQAPPQVLS